MESMWKKRAKMFIEMQKKNRALHKVINVIAVIAVIITAYVLILPAVAMEEKKGCDLELHQHTQECLDGENHVVCGYADFVVHTHDKNCYNKDGILQCTLPEIKEHAHDASCYVEEKRLACGLEETEGHTHQPQCYGQDRGDLICGQEEHTHGEGCYNENGELICEIPEHIHTDDCYHWEPVLICGQEEQPGHTHTDACYVTERKLVCDKPEVILHTHTDACYENGQRVCGKTEIRKHQHNENCFKDNEPETTPEATPEPEITPEAEATPEPEITPEVEEEPQSEEQLEAPTETPVETPGTPLKVDPYIKGFEVYYKDKVSQKWVQITNQTTNVPGDATVILKIQYQEVSITDLKAAGNKLSYILPPLLKEPTVGGKLTSNGEEIGTIISDGNGVVLEFYEKWLQEQENLGQQHIGGDFYVESQIDGSHVKPGEPGYIEIGGIKIEVHFEKDVEAKYGNVIVEKGQPVYSEDTDGAYLTYELTAKVPEGAASVPDVKVVDHFAHNAQYIKEYMGVTGTAADTKAEGDPVGPTERYPEGKTRGQVYLGNTTTTENPIPDPAGAGLTKPGVLVWTMGEMAAGDIRVLKYKVKLDEKYKGVNAGGTTQPIKNVASVYSKTYLRKETEQVFTPTVRVDLRKTAGEYTPYEGKDGGSLTYTIWLQADKNNTYVLENVKVNDYFRTTEIVPYVDYVEGSFHLYEGNGTAGKEIKLNDVKPETAATNPVIKTSETDPKKSFDLYVGDLKQGEERTITYTVDVKPGLWATGNNDKIRLGNRAEVLSNDKWEGGSLQYNGYNSDKDLAGKRWSRKIAGEFSQTEKTITIPAGEDVYNENLQKESSPGSFVVPANSQEYQLVVNEDGIWDFSEVQFRDSLQQTYMIHTGYLQISAYDMTVATGEKITDQQAIDKVKAGKLVKTAWVKIDGQKEFGFKPSQIGIGGKYAYLVKYYVSVQNIGDLQRPVLRNKFHIDGNITGPHSTIVSIPGIDVENSVTVQGGVKYNLKKEGWYYQRPKEGAAQNWEKGELYWGIKAEGNRIPKGMKIKDFISDTRQQKLYQESLIAIYKGVLPDEKQLKDFKNIEELEKAGLTKLNGVYQESGRVAEDPDYRWEIREKNQYLFIEFKKDIILDEAKGECLYAIVKTAPQRLPQGNRETEVFGNTIQGSTLADEGWHNYGSANITVYGSDEVFKESQAAYTYDGKDWTNITGSAYPHRDTSRLIKEWVTEPGTYVEWLVHLNGDGSMSGSAQIKDKLPEGVELTYVRYYWNGPGYPEQEIPATPDISDLEGNPDWEKATRTGNMDNSSAQRSCTSYYNRKTGEIRWDVDKLKAGGKNRDDYGVEFQVLCKVTDKDALMSGQNATKNNTVEVTDSAGTYTDSDSITFRKNSLKKVGEYDPKVHGGKYPFKIELNPLGEDLMPGADTVTLVDELSSTLTVFSPSVKIVNTKTGEDLKGKCVIQIDMVENSQIMHITVPDATPLTITYEAIVNAKPGQQISISNKAHWEGYETPEGGIVTNPSFSYAAGGSAGADKHPTLKLTKVDKGNISQTLPGATFSVQEVVLQSDGTYLPTGEKHTEVTNADGIAVFSGKDPRWMKYNKIYCLKEEQAPAGYVKDDAPYYFVIVGKEGGERSYPADVHPWYQGAEYLYTAYNRKGEIAVEKKFAREDGSPLDTPLNGSYRFGLYEKENGEGEPLQTLTIIYENGQARYEKDGHEVIAPVFTELEVKEQTKYYIFELDDSGRPIMNGGMATVDGKTFAVTYGNNGVTPSTEEANTTKVTVTNQTKQFTLPETGGMGIQFHMIAGTILLSASVLGYILQKRKRRFS